MRCNWNCLKWYRNVCVRFSISILGKSNWKKSWQSLRASLTFVLNCLIKNLLLMTLSSDLVADAVDVQWWGCTSCCRRRRFYEDEQCQPWVHDGERWQHWAICYPAVYTAVVSAASPHSDVQRSRDGRTLPLDAPAAAAAAAGLRRAGWQRGGLRSDGESRISDQRQQLWRHST